jgi:hypothetical protein
MCTAALLAVTCRLCLIHLGAGHLHTWFLLLPHILLCVQGASWIFL